MLTVGILVGCAKAPNDGPVNVYVIQPNGPGCQYVVAPARLSTLQSLKDLKGALGQVVIHSDRVESRAEILDAGKGFAPVDVEFSESGGVYYPADYSSLYATSLYYAIERGYQYFSELDPIGDIKPRAGDLSETRIVYEARRISEDSKNEIVDNAEYLPHRVGNGLRNYFFSFPTIEVNKLALGLNTGVMVHEYTHLVLQYLFYEPGIARNLMVDEKGKPTANVLAAFDEGMADYFGFLVTQDPGYFDCSVPDSGRNLAQARFYTHSLKNQLYSDDDFDPHVLGSLLASISYEIGETLGNHTASARSILRLMNSLVDCPEARSGNVLSLDVETIAACHARYAVDSRVAQVVQQVYAKYLLGGSR